MITVDAQTKTIEIDAGDQEQVKFTLTNTSDGSVYDATGASYRFVVKDSLEDAIGSALIDLNDVDDSAQWDLTNETIGIILLEFLPADTNSLGGNKYHYGLQVTDVGAKPHTPRSGIFAVNKNPVI